MFKFAWQARVELASLAIPGAAYYGLYRKLGPIAAAIILGTALAALIGIRPTRRFIWKSLRIAFFKRRWHEALTNAAIPALRGRVFPARKVRPMRGGAARFDIRVGGGVAVSDLVGSCEVLAAMLGARAVHVRRDVANASIAHVTVLKSDPFATGDRLVSPLTSAKTTSLWEPITLGYDETGEVVAARLPERHLLIGGEPGAGKSVALNLITAAAALDPSVTLYLFDGKMVELAPWRHCAASFVTTSIDEANALLAAIVNEMTRRYEDLAAHDKKKVEPGSDLGLICVVIDELAMYTTYHSPAERKRFEHLLRDLVARGRAAGVIVVAATQKPSSDTVDTTLRDAFSSRFALRCSTRDASDTILGGGLAAKGFSAADIDPATRGVGLLHHEGTDPVLVRTAQLTDDEVRFVAARAAAARNAGNGALACGALQ